MLSAAFGMWAPELGEGECRSWQCEYISPIQWRGKGTEIRRVASANVIRHSHCSGPPDEILNVEAIYAALDCGETRVRIARNAAVPGKDGFLCPSENSWEDQPEVNCPCLKSITLKLSYQKTTSGYDEEYVTT